MLGFLAVAVAVVGWIGLFIVLATAPQAGRSTAPNPRRNTLLDIRLLPVTRR
jgi:hypothetical protein